MPPLAVKITSTRTDSLTVFMSQLCWVGWGSKSLAARASTARRASCGRTKMSTSSVQRGRPKAAEAMPPISAYWREASSRHWVASARILMKTSSETSWRSNSTLAISVVSLSEKVLLILSLLGCVDLCLWVDEMDPGEAGGQVEGLAVGTGQLQP